MRPRLLGLLAGLVLAATLAPVPAAADEVVRGTTTVRTLPPVAGFAFAYHGGRYVTDATGQVQVPRALSNESHRLETLTPVIPLPGGREARFEKWYGTSKLASARGATTAALSMWTSVAFRFTDLDGKPVERSSLGQVTVKSSTGYLLELPRDASERPLQATRVVPDQEGLSVKDLYYTVQTVDVEGNNVVNRSQTKLVPRTDREVTVPLLFFDATVRAKDALFGFGVGGSLELRYPNGRSREIELGSGGAALPGLPRGQYEIAVRGPGLRIVQPVTMSRPQAVDLKVFTWWDVAAVLLVGLATASGLVLAGRRVHRRRLARDGTEPPLAVPAALNGVVRPSALALDGARRSDER